MMYNGIENTALAPEMNLRDILAKEIMELTDEQAEYVLRWLMCSKQESN